jgi:hypothetical protein
MDMTGEKSYHDISEATAVFEEYRSRENRRDVWPFQVVNVRVRTMGIGANEYVSQ